MDNVLHVYHHEADGDTALKLTTYLDMSLDVLLEMGIQIVDITLVYRNAIALMYAAFEFGESGFSHRRIEKKERPGEDIYFLYVNRRLYPDLESEIC